MWVARLDEANVQSLSVTLLAGGLTECCSLCYAIAVARCLPP